MDLHLHFSGQNDAAIAIEADIATVASVLYRAYQGLVRH
jgi:hypothetical protein